jgi:hypothetical protein
MGQHGHDFAGYHGHSPIQRPHRTDRIEIVDPGRLDTLAPFLVGTPRQKTVAPNSLDKCDCGYVDRMMRQVRTHPA